MRPSEAEAQWLEEWGFPEDDSMGFCPDHERVAREAEEDRSSPRRQAYFAVDGSRGTSVGRLDGPARSNP